MPVHNAARYLNHAIDSVLLQTFADFRLLIIDDGSEDESIDIVRSYDDSRIQLDMNSKNLGYGATLNVGLAKTETPFVARMDADDICLPTRLDSQLKYLQEHSDVEGVSCFYECIDSSGEKITDDYGLIRPTSVDLLAWSFHFGSYFLHPGGLFRRQFFERHGVYDDRYSPAEDYELWLRAMPRPRLTNLPEALMLYRVHNKNVSRTENDNRVRNAARALAMWLSRLLGREISRDMAWSLRHVYTVTNEKQAIETAMLLEELCQKFIYEVNPCPADRFCIQRDTVRRVRYLCDRFLQRSPDQAAKILSRHDCGELQDNNSFSSIPIPL
ncbi:glycosyltransferase family 2 protein [Pseudomonadota bacterium]